MLVAREFGHSGGYGAGWGGVGFPACKPEPGAEPRSSYLRHSCPSSASGVSSVSLCTTTLVTDMSGCCSLASLMA